MKKRYFLMLMLLSLALLCACGAPAASSPQPDATAAPDAAATPTEQPPTQTAAPAPQPSDAPQDPEPISETPAANELFDAAAACIDQPVSALYDAIGEPLSSDYAPSCMAPDAEDGNLYYDGFTVYTLRTRTSEVVVFVE